MAIPITVTCECGTVHAVDLGEEVRCGCGRLYETSRLAPERFAHVRAKRARVRLYLQLGIVFIAGTTLVMALVWGVRGVAIGTPLSGLIWFLFLGRWFRKRWLRDVYSSTTMKLEASER
jgi:hypothetical protein